MSAATFRLRPLSDLFEVDKAQICKDETDYSKLQFIGLENIESHTKRYLPEFVSKPEGVCHRFSKCFRFALGILPPVECFTASSIKVRLCKIVEINSLL